MDRETAVRHVMQANKSKNTGPELLVRTGLREAGLPGYRLHWKKAAGRPDICYPGRHIAIFVNGCYWHRCPWCSLPNPKSNVSFWEAKFARNKARDQENVEALVADGWTVLLTWECRLKKERREGTLEQIVSEVQWATEHGAEGRVVEIGAPTAWRLRVARKRLGRHLR